MKIIRLSILIVVSLLVLCPTHVALADAAPPLPPPGTSLEPDNSITNVQMLWEDVLMTIADDSATVQAVFRLQNQGAEIEIFYVRFPLGMSVQGPITHFIASVNGIPAPITTVEQPSDLYDDTVIPWATWPATFPPGTPVEIFVTYTVAAYHHNGITALDRYAYILVTGAGWYNTIGEGTVTFRLPYEVDESTVCIGDKCGQKPLPDWYTVSGTDVIWQFTNLEPTEADNIELIILDPALHRSLLDARSQTRLNSGSPDAHLKLARLIRPAINARCGGIWDYGCSYAEGPTTDLIPEALNAYRRALEIMPNDADLYAEYLEFLISTEGYIEEIAPELFPKLEYALTLDPDNERLAKICSGLEEIGLWSPASSRPSLNPAETQPPGSVGVDTPSYSQTPVLSDEVPAVVGSLATKPALVTGIAPSASDRITAWLIILSVLGLFFTGTAGVIIVVLRKIL